MTLNRISLPQPRLWAVLGRFILILGIAPMPLAAAESDPDRPVHEYLEVRISPDAAFVASIEGDAPAGGYYPDLRELVIRATNGIAEARIALPCGRVPQCWPGSLAWSPDGKQLSFTVRTPGSHAYGLYRVAADGSGLSKLLDFSGTLSDLKYSTDGTLALLAVENARKEVGATEAGAPIAGDLDAPPAEQRIAMVTGRRTALGFARRICLSTNTTGDRVGRVLSERERRATVITIGGSPNSMRLERAMGARV